MPPLPQASCFLQCRHYVHHAICLYLLSVFLWGVASAVACIISESVQELQKSFKAKNADQKEVWRCPPCRNGGSASAQNNSLEVSDMKAILASISEKLASLPLLAEKVDGMEQSLRFMSNKFDDFEKTISRQDNELKELRKKVVELEEREASRQTTHSELERQINELEYRNRRLNLEIHGVPAGPNENLIESLNTVADKLRVPHLEASEVVSVHRLPAKPEKIPGIIVRFAQQQTRDSWLAKKRNLKQSDSAVFVQENLTRHCRELLKESKNVARDKSYEYVWYSHGKVLVRKTKGARAVRIRSYDDLHRL